MVEATKEAGRQAVKKAISRVISVDGMGGYSRHLLLCIGKSCCDGEDHEDTLKRLNKRLSKPQKAGLYVYRTEVGCLNFCRSGPLLVVYPDGTWYHSVTPEVLDRIVVEHIVGGHVVAEYAFANNPMRDIP